MTHHLVRETAAWRERPYILSVHFCIVYYASTKKILWSSRKESQVHSDFQSVTLNLFSKEKRANDTQADYLLETGNVSDLISWFLIRACTQEGILRLFQRKS